MYEYKGTVVKITDGDTVHMMVDFGFGSYRKIIMRFKGIDTPEIYRPSCQAELEHGREAKQFLVDRILNKEVTFVSYKDRTGKYGRYLADIAYERDGQLILLTEELIANGFEKKEKY